jgi:hypothetical protein
MTLNSDLNKAKHVKRGEFCTQLVDIENELRHYRRHFQGKIVYCNCDDPTVSNFYKYFSLNYGRLALRGLRTTCYRNPNPDAFSRRDSDRAVWLECPGGGLLDGAYVPNAPVVRDLDGDGDFRSAECRELLESADVVVTNPPFSLFREYVAQLIESGKEFLILGQQNAIKYKEIFPLIQSGRMWLGVDNGGCKWFEVNPEYEIKTESRQKTENGKRYFSMGSVSWFTNLDHAKRHEELILYREYSPEVYPTYDNYDAIEVSRVKDIPKDYDGLMGVPITFLDKHNPEQFEIVGVSNLWDTSVESHKFYDDWVETRPDGSLTGLGGGKINGECVMRGSRPGGNRIVKGDEVVHKLYTRIFIRRRPA